MSLGIGFIPKPSGQPRVSSSYSKAARMYDEYAGKYSDLIMGAAETTKAGIEEAAGLRDYYKPGGGYGEGLRKQAKETVQAGEAKALGSQVAAGMSSQFGARGVNVLAAAELSKLYANIEDTRNQLLANAFQPYAQMIQSLGMLTQAGAGIVSAAPKPSQYMTTGSYGMRRA